MSKKFILMLLLCFLVAVDILAMSESCRYVASAISASRSREELAFWAEIWVDLGCG